MIFLRGPRRVAAFTLALGLALSAAAAVWQGRENRAIGEQAIEALARKTADEVAARMQRYGDGLRGLRGAVASVGAADFDSQHFRAYNATRELAKEFPGARGFGVILRVAPDRQAAFVAAARRDAQPDFSLRQIGPNAGERYVVRWYEPIAGRSSLGLDLASEAHRREAAQASMRSGAATLSAPITLTEEPSRAGGAFSLLLPIYPAGTAAALPAEREAAALGWTFAPLLIDEVLAGIVGPSGPQMPDPRFELRLSDASVPGGKAFFDSAAEPAPATSALQRQLRIPVFGRVWLAELRARPAFVGELRLADPGRTAATGATIAALAAALAYLLATGGQRARVARQELARHSAIVAGSSDAIVGQTLAGSITDWNASAQRLFGHAGEAALGRPAADLLLPPGRAAEDAAIRGAIARGELVLPFDTTRLRADGSLVEVSVAASPIFAADGRCMGLSTTLRDISEARRAQRALGALNASLEQQVGERTAQLATALHDLRAIVDAVPSMVGYWDRDLVNRVANRAYAEWFGVPLDRVEGQPMRSLLGDALFEQDRPYIEAALQGLPKTFERDLARPDGSGLQHALAHYVPDLVDGQVRGFYAIVHDVSDLVRGRRQLAAVQRENSALLTTIKRYAIVSVADRAGRITEFSDSFCQISGYGRDELVGQNHRIVNSGVHGHAFWADMWRTVSSGEAWRGEVCNRAKDGSLYWVDSIIAPFVGDDGRYDKYVSIRTDITARKRLQEELGRARNEAEASERFLREITDRIPLRIAYVDRDLRYRFVNEGQCRRFGRERQDIIGRTRFELTREPPDAVSQARLTAVLGGEPRRYQLEEPGADGPVIFDVQLVPDRDGAGFVHGFYSVSSDVTESKRIELDLLRTSSLLNTVLASASEFSIIATDPQLQIKVFNAGAERLLGYDADEMIGRATPLMIHELDEIDQRAAALSGELGRRIEGGDVLTEAGTLGQAREWTFVRKDGSRVPVSLVMTEMRTSQRGLFGYLGIAHDISPQREQESLLRQAMQKATHANRAKTRFLANMSHEIRTPLNAVIGLSYLLERSELNAEQAGLIAKIKLAGRSLLATVNDVLDLSKIEAAELKLECAPFDPARLLDELFQLMTVQAEAKGVALEMHTAAELPAALEGDATRLHQILSNLLSNAIKFTVQGTVSLDVRVQWPATGLARLRFVVKDSGIGIEPEALARVFTPFVQADASTTRRFGGTGLGLAIVKQLATQMGGEIGVSSTPGQGSEFWVEIEFPLAAGSPPPLRDAPAANLGPGLTGVRVLVADDSQINREVAGRILELEGARVAFANNGQEAVDRLLADPQAFDVVLMDMQMPILDGLDATRRIRSGLGLLRLPIIALTAASMVSEQQLAEAAGMNAFVSKPFDPPGLVACIRRLVRIDGQAPAGPELSAKPAQPGQPGLQGLPPGWPQIAGIDGVDACRRLGGDRRLFRAMLDRLVQGAADLEAVAAAASPDLVALSALLHGLKGSAATLGAKDIARLAAEAESACRALDLGRGRPLLLSLASELGTLQAALALQPADPADLLPTGPDDEAQAPAAPLDPAELAQLLLLLRQCNLDAMPRFDALGLQLRRSLGPAAYTVVRAQVENLQFEAAADALQAIAA